VICVTMWLFIAAGNVQHSITGKTFLAPCLGKDLDPRKPQERKKAANVPEKGEV
jgi:hypothetical protein